MAISCEDALWGAVVARMNLFGYLLMTPAISLLEEVSIHLMGRVRG